MTFSDLTQTDFASEISDSTVAGAFGVPFESTEVTNPVVNPFIKSKLNIIGFNDVKL